MEPGRIDEEDDRREQDFARPADDEEQRREQIDPFNALNSSLLLSLDPNNSEAEKVIVQSLAGVGPDLFDCYAGYQLTAYVKAGIAWDVTDELKSRGVELLNGPIDRPWGIRTASFRDPGGHIWEIAH